MDEQKFQRMAQELARRSPADRTWTIGQLVHSMGQQVPEDAGSGLGRGKRGEGSPAGRPGRKKKAAAAPRIRLYPTNSARLNRALAELSLTAQSVHSLLWQWRGAPARGNLPFFTIKGVAKHCRMARNTARSALRELTLKGWIRRAKPNPHHKNTLYKLVPIREVPVPPDRRPVRRSFEAESAKGAAS